MQSSLFVAIAYLMYHRFTGAKEEIERRGLNMEHTEVINVEYYPDLPKTEIANRCKYCFSFTDLSDLGIEFSTLATAIASVAESAPSQEGLYRCVFPEGVAGKLASFKDNSGNIGTIMNNNKIVGQARWIPAEASAASMVIDPVTLAVAVGMMSLNQKLDEIKETQKEILDFLQKDKESELEASLKSLIDIQDQYRFNSDNDIWKSGKLTSITNIKGTAEKNIVFYRKGIVETINKRKILHSRQNAEKIKSTLEHDFKCYKFSVFVLAYASYLEVVLTGNSEKIYLKHMVNKIREYLNSYQMEYTQCYNQLEEYMNGSVQAIALDRIGKVGTKAGEKLAKMPILRKGPVDEVLVAVGKKMENASSEISESAMMDFRDNRITEIQQFIENIEIINEVSNSPVEVLFDRDNIYLVA